MLQMKCVVFSIVKWLDMQRRSITVVIMRNDRIIAKRVRGLDLGLSKYVQGQLRKGFMHPTTKICNKDFVVVRKALLPMFAFQQLVSKKFQELSNSTEIDITICLHYNRSVLKLFLEMPNEEAN